MMTRVSLFSLSLSFYDDIYKNSSLFPFFVSSYLHLSRLLLLVHTHKVGFFVWLGLFFSSSFFFLSVFEEEEEEVLINKLTRRFVVSSERRRRRRRKENRNDSEEEEEE